MSLQRCGVCRRVTLANFCSSCQRGMSGNLDMALLDALAAEERRLDGMPSASSYPAKSTEEAP